MTNTQIIDALKEQGVNADLIATIESKLCKTSTELSEKAQAVVDLLSKHSDSYLYSADIAEELGIPAKSITGVLTGLVNKGLIVKETGDGGKKVYKLA